MEEDTNIKNECKCKEGHGECTCENECKCENKSQKEKKHKKDHDKR